MAIQFFLAMGVLGQSTRRFSQEPPLDRWGFVGPVETDSAQAKGQQRL